MSAKEGEKKKYCWKTKRGGVYVWEKEKDADRTLRLEKEEDKKEEKAERMEGNKKRVISLSPTQTGEAGEART